MAEIHLAKTRGIAGFEKYVALKMIHPNFAQDEQFIQMLIDEAKIAVQLQHVNVAQTFDLGRVGDTYYITMEFVDGADLYKILRRGSEQDLDMPLDVCAFIAKEMATGLDYAHRKKDMGGVSLGIVHRDISPQNVLVSNAGEVKLVDFGIAKATMKVRQTAVGVIKGKYYYMSPEQAWGDPLDHRSDIFSAGIVLYEMMTGQMLYLEEDLHRLLDMVRRAAIAPPTTLRRDVPPQLERIVMHALAKNAADRYQSAGDMASDLERFLHGYSPVFTASKLATHLRKVLGEPVPAPAPAPVVVARDPNLNTQPIDRGALLRERSDLHDENSVIFRVDELRRKAEAAARGEREPDEDDDGTDGDFDEGAATSDELPARARPGTGQPARAKLPAVSSPSAKTQPAPDPRARPAPRPPATPSRAPAAPAVPNRSQSAPTAPVRGPLPSLPRASAPRAPQPSDYGDSAPTLPPQGPASRDSALDLAELDHVEEMTMVSGPPGFGGGASAARDGGAGLDGFGDYEPTMVEADPDADSGRTRSSHDDDGGPTMTRDPRGPLAATAADSSSATAPHSESRGRLRPAPPGSIAHPALAARTPTPAVSELRKPRSSRRTPPGGVPAAGSVLQSIVGGSVSEPLPTRPVRGGGAPSDGVPARAADGASSQSPTVPEAGRGAVPQPMPPSYGQPGWPQQPNAYPVPQAGYGYPPGGLPAVAQPYPAADLPPHLQPYAQLPQAAQTIAPGMSPQTPYPFLPYGGQPPPTFTKQLTALEADELPAHLRLDNNRPNWILRGLLAAALVVGGVAVALLVLRDRGDAQPAASLLIDSVPPGAAVTIDGAALPNPTPVAFTDTQPGARHDIRVALPGKKPWTQAIVVPQAGGEVKVVAFLQAITGSLTVTSSPSGAEVYFGDDVAPRGRTPLHVNDLDPSTVTRIKITLKDYAPEVRTLDWSSATDLQIDAKLKK
ncbi:MAG: protein kinase [Deltaproteobacteria bacterium]|nr:protein kinase [Deltaproteobacteria bacterium]